MAAADDREQNRQIIRERLVCEHEALVSVALSLGENRALEVEEHGHCQANEGSKEVCKRFDESVRVSSMSCSIIVEEKLCHGILHHVGQCHKVSLTEHAYF